MLVRNIELALFLRCLYRANLVLRVQMRLSVHLDLIKVDVFVSEDFRPFVAGEINWQPVPVLERDRVAGDSYLDESVHEPVALLESGTCRVHARRVSHHYDAAAVSRHPVNHPYRCHRSVIVFDREIRSSLFLKLEPFR